MGTEFAKPEGRFAATIAILIAKCLNNKAADVAELVDARDLKSLGLARTGSIPVVRTIPVNPRLSTARVDRLINAYLSPRAPRTGLVRQPSRPNDPSLKFYQ